MGLLFSNYRISKLHRAVESTYVDRAQPVWINDDAREDDAKILIVIDGISKNEVSSGRYLSGTSSFEVLDNILKRLPGWKEVRVLEWNPFGSPRELHESDRDRMCRQRVLSIYERFGAQSLVAMGPQSIRALVRKLPPKIDPTRSINYMIKEVGSNLDGQEVEYNVVPCLSLRSVANAKRGDDAKFIAPLAGFIMHAVEAAIYGKNRYTVSMEDCSWRVLTNLEDVKGFFRRVRGDFGEISSLDVEGDSLDRMNNRLLTLQGCFDRKRAYVVPYLHHEAQWTSDERAVIADYAQRAFEESTSPYHIYHHAKFDVNQLVREFKLRYYRAPLWDTMASLFQLGEDRKGIARLTRNPIYSLEQLMVENGCYYYTIGGKQTGYKPLTKSKEDRNRMDTWTLQEIADYGCPDVLGPYQAHRFHQEEARRRGYVHFDQVVTRVISDQLHDFVQMERNGLPVDLKYLDRQLLPNSDFSKALDTLRVAMMQHPEVQKVNALLLEAKGGGQAARSIFGSNEEDANTEWVFNPDDNKHLHKLFFEVMELEPTGHGEDGRPSLDKQFKTTYQGNAVVKDFTEYVKGKKLFSSFIKGFRNILENYPDMKFDWTMRPQFKFVDVVTGRAGAEKPSLHQVPERNVLAKFVKREFVARNDDVFFKGDYNAMEVRGWANVARDELLLAAFQAGLDYRRALRLIKVVDEAVVKWAKETKLKTDVHRINYGFFHGVAPETVTAEQRQSVKVVVFGVIYGMSAKGLAASLTASNLEAAAKAKRPLEEKDIVTDEQAQELIDLLFKRFPVGADWIHEVEALAKKQLWVESPLGRIRHLYWYLHDDRALRSMADRRGPNAIVQGMSSDAGFIGGRILHDLKWFLFERQGQPLTIRPCNKVHDSSELLSHIIELPLGMYLFEHAATTQCHRAFERDFGFKLGLDFELELNFGQSLDSVKEWDGTRDKFSELLQATVKWRQDELRMHTPSRDIQDCEHNMNVLFALRREELKEAQEYRERGRVYDRMHLNRDNALEMGLRFFHDRERV